MNLALTIVAIVIWAWLAVIWIRRIKARREFERISISPEALHELIVGQHDIVILDVRQPLDLLADSEIIEGARRISPEDATTNPALIPTDKELVVYCTCPSDKTSRNISQRAHALNFLRVRFLKGGLAAWKLKGYPVEPYRESFRLDTAH